MPKTSKFSTTFKVYRILSWRLPPQESWKQIPWPYLAGTKKKVIFPFGKENPLSIGWKGETIRHNFARYPNNRAQLPPGCSLRFGTWLFVLAVLLAPKSRASQVEIPIELASFHASHSAVPSQTLPKFNQEKKTIPYLLLFYRQSSIPNMTLLPKSNFLGSQKLPPPYSRPNLLWRSPVATRKWLEKSHQFLVEPPIWKKYARQIWIISPIFGI